MTGIKCIQGTFQPGEIISLTYKDNKARFRVTWIGNPGTDRANQIGVQSIDPTKCIWDASILPPTATDTYAAKAKERRQHGRVPCRFGAELHIEGAGALVRGEITNLSEGGCFMAMSTLPEDKRRLKIVVWVNDNKLAMQGVVASRRPGFGISIKFTEMTEEVRQQLQSFIQSHLVVRGR
jgi:hypothetical protein